jgi:hypothetical protein
VCYGYGELVGNHQGIVVLLAEKLDCTFDKAFCNMRTQELSEDRTIVIEHMLMLTVRQMMAIAVKGLYFLRDWHVQNIAFNNVEHSGMPVDMRLIDWAGHSQAPWLDQRQRVDNAMKALLRSLPGQQEWRPDAAGDEQTMGNVKAWDDYMERCTDTLSRWWRDLTFPVQESDLVALEACLTQIDKCAEQSAGLVLSTSSVTDHLSGTQCASIACPWSATAPSGSARARATPSIPHITGKQYPSGSSSGAPVAPPPKQTHILDILPGCPPLLMRSLLDAARMRRQHTMNAFRQGQIHRNHKVTLESRFASSSPEDLEHHGGKSKPHTYTVPEGDEMSVLFGILLKDFEFHGLTKRIIAAKCHGGKQPIQSTDPNKFHRTYASSFKEICKRGFNELSPGEQREKLSEFLRKKFSVDPVGKVMVPKEGKRRKILSWSGFHITDDELPAIVDRVIHAYGASRSEAASSD